MWREKKKRIIYNRYIANATYSHIIKVLTVISFIDILYSGYYILKMAIYHCWLPLQNKFSQSNHEKNRKISITRHCLKYLANNPQNQPHSQKQEKFETHSQDE